MVKSMLPNTDAIAQAQIQLLADVRLFAPELILVVTIVAMLLLRLFHFAEKQHLAGVALAGSCAALLTLLGPTLGLWPHLDQRTAFAGMLVFDPLAPLRSIVAARVCDGDGRLHPRNGDTRCDGLGRLLHAVARGDARIDA